MNKKIYLGKWTGGDGIGDTVKFVADTDELAKEYMYMLLTHDEYLLDEIDENRKSIKKIKGGIHAAKPNFTPEEKI